MSPTQILPSRRLLLGRRHKTYHFGAWDWALPSLEANTLACCYFMDAVEYVRFLSQRQRLLFFIAQQVASCWYWSLLYYPKALGVTGGGKVYSAHREGFCCSWGTLSKHALCPGGDGVIPLMLLAIDTTWEMAPVESSQGLESLVFQPDV